MKKWSIFNIWNELVTSRRPLTPRNYIYASELGQPFIDRILKMRGIKTSNPFTSRVLRIFDCGNVFEVEVMEKIFKLLGIFISSQTRLIIKTKKCLDVVGKHDPRVGGKIDYEAAIQAINDPSTSEWIRPRALAVLEHMIKKYPNGLEEIITEIKSVNSMAFWSHKNMDEKTGFFKGYPHHKLQLYTYIKNIGIPGKLLYLSKDDLTLAETHIPAHDKKLEKLWLADVQKMTQIYQQSQYKPLLQKTKNGTLTIADWLKPYQEKNIIWNKEKKEYEKNWKALHSNYLTLITGFKDEEEWGIFVHAKLKTANTIKCPSCEKEYTRATLNKYNGICGRCTKKKEKEALLLKEKEQKLKNTKKD